VGLIAVTKYFLRAWTAQAHEQAVIVQLQPIRKDTLRSYAKILCHAQAILVRQNRAADFAGRLLLAGRAGMLLVK
jgi:hypothetical protein